MAGPLPRPVPTAFAAVLWRVQLVHKITETRKTLQKYEAEEAEMRAILVMSIAGPDSDPARYADTSIEQLLDMCGEAGRRSGSRSGSREGKRPGSRQSAGEGAAGGDGGDGGATVNVAQLSEAAQVDIRGLEE